MQLYENKKNKEINTKKKGMHSKLMGRDSQDLVELEVEVDSLRLFGLTLLSGVHAFR